MASISASTTHKVVKKTTAKAPPKSTGILKSGASAKLKSNGSAPPLQRRGSVAPKLKASELNHPDSLSKFLALSEGEQKDRIVNEFLAHCFGERATFHEGIAKPHTASTTQSRGAAAADIAIAVKSLGPIVVLKRFGVLNEMEMTLLPQGIGEFIVFWFFVTQHCIQFSPLMHERRCVWKWARKRQQPRWRYEKNRQYSKFG
jgi:hypothetical protein